MKKPKKTIETIKNMHPQAISDAIIKGRFAILIYNLLKNKK